MAYYFFVGGLSCTITACVMLIDKGPPREGMNPYQYGNRRGAEWMRPELSALGGSSFIFAALFWIVEAVVG